MIIIIIIKIKKEVLRAWALPIYCVSHHNWFGLALGPKMASGCRESGDCSWCCGHCKVQCSTSDTCLNPFPCPDHWKNTGMRIETNTWPLLTASSLPPKLLSSWSRLPKEPQKVRGECRHVLMVLLLGGGSLDSIVGRIGNCGWYRKIGQIRLES
jgi:hypothetical protein